MYEHFELKGLQRSHEMFIGHIWVIWPKVQLVGVVVMFLVTIFTMYKEY